MKPTSVFAAALVAIALPVTSQPTLRLSAQMSGQSFQVVVEPGRSTVGDPVTIRFRVRLDERDKLLDSTPQVVGQLTPGVRVLAVGPLSRTPDRIYHGQATIAFYRPGRQQVPIFGVGFMRAVVGITRATLPSDSATVEITPVLPAGEPSLKDIKELEPSTVPLWPLGAALVLGAGALYLFLRRRRRKPIPRPVAQEPLPPPALEPFDRALQELGRVEQERWPELGQVGLHYQAVVDVLREYLNQAEGVGARERTTLELLWALPPHLTGNGLRGRCHEILAQADLVKFAAVRPTVTDASDFLGATRQLVRDWHQAAGQSRTSDALR